MLTENKSTSPIQAMSHQPPSIVVGVAAAVWNDRHEVLLIRCTKPPRMGEWSVAETIADAEAGAARVHFVLIDYAARVVSGEAVAASDAADATWVPIGELANYPMWDEMRRIIVASERIAFSA